MGGIFEKALPPLFLEVMAMVTILFDFVVIAFSVYAAMKERCKRMDAEKRLAIKISEFNELNAEHTALFARAKAFSMDVIRFSPNSKKSCNVKDYPYNDLSD